MPSSGALDASSPVPDREALDTHKVRPRHRTGGHGDTGGGLLAPRSPHQSRSQSCRGGPSSCAPPRAAAAWGARSWAARGGREAEPQRGLVGIELFLAVGRGGHREAAPALLGRGCPLLWGIPCFGVTSPGLGSHPLLWGRGSGVGGRTGRGAVGRAHDGVEMGAFGDRRGQCTCAQGSLGWGEQPAGRGWGPCAPAAAPGWGVAQPPGIHCAHPKSPGALPRCHTGWRGAEQWLVEQGGGCRCHTDGGVVLGFGVPGDGPQPDTGVVAALAMASVRLGVPAAQGRAGPARSWVAAPSRGEASRFLGEAAASPGRWGHGLPRSRRGDWGSRPAGCQPAAGAAGLGSAEFLRAPSAVAATRCLPGAS